MFGATLAAALGLSYAFASHFAPGALQDAVAAYRAEFQPSAQLASPYVIAGLNVIAADDEEDAQRQLQSAKRSRVSALFGRGRRFTDEEADAVLASDAGRSVEQMVVYSAVGTPEKVKDYVEAFVKHADADELIVAHQSPTPQAQLRSVELLAEVMGLADQR